MKVQQNSYFILGFSQSSQYRPRGDFSKSGWGSGKITSRVAKEGAIFKFFAVIKFYF